MKKRLMMALAAGALVAWMLPGVASAQANVGIWIAPPPGNDATAVCLSITVDLSAYRALRAAGLQATNEEYFAYCVA